MPLETGTFISDLVTSNPAASDPLSNADDHVRLVKATIKATFPNITGAITSTQTAIDAAAATITNGVTLLGSAHAYNAGLSGLNFPSASQMDLVVNGFTPLSLHQDLSAQFFGSASFAGAITGPGITPIGGMIMWLSDTLPASSAGSWCWANGGVLSRTGNGAALWALWGNTSPYGLGDGTTTFNVINMCEASPVGKSGMGGAGSPGLLNSISSGLKGVLGGIFGSDTSTLSTTNLPPYTPAGTNSITVNIGTNGNPRSLFTGGGASDFNTSGGTAQGNLFAAGSGITLTSAFTGTAQGGVSTAFNNVGPRRVCNFIIRIG